MFLQRIGSLGLGNKQSHAWLSFYLKIRGQASICARAHYGGAKSKKCSSTNRRLFVDRLLLWKELRVDNSLIVNEIQYDFRAIFGMISIARNML